MNNYATFEYIKFSTGKVVIEPYIRNFIVINILLTLISIESSIVDFCKTMLYAH